MKQAKRRPSSHRLVLTQQVTDRLERFDMIANDLDDPQCGDGEDHAGYAPYQVAGKQYEDGENRVDVDLGLHDQGRDDIKLDALNERIGNQYARHHIETAALG